MALTVGQLIKELQRAVIVDELDEDSEVLDANLEEAVLTINPDMRHVVVE